MMTRCGYHEQSTFRRQFKATYGVSPSKYKKQILGIADKGDDNKTTKEKYII